jgi:hypothetical protein
MKPKYYANYAVRQNGGLQCIGGRRFKPSDTTVTIKKETFIVDIASPIYRNKKGRFIYLFEQGKGQVLTKSDVPVMSPKLTKAVFKQEIFKQLVSGLDQGSVGWNLLIWAIMGALGGTGLGWILCSQFGGA